jgi:hypothetical protein
MGIIDIGAFKIFVYIIFYKLYCFSMNISIFTINEILNARKIEAVHSGDNSRQQIKYKF